MANQETSPNSGRSFSRPSRRRPYLENATYSRKNAQTFCVPTYSQAKFWVTQLCHFAACASVSSGATSAEMEKPHSTMTASAVTTQLRRSTRRPAMSTESQREARTNRNSSASSVKSATGCSSHRRMSSKTMADVVERSSPVEARSSLRLPREVSAGGAFPSFRGSRSVARGSSVNRAPGDASSARADSWKKNRTRCAVRRIFMSSTLFPLLSGEKDSSVRCVVLPILPRLPSYYWSGVRRRRGPREFFDIEGNGFSQNDFIL